jgi:hypothetical protein
MSFPLYDSLKNNLPLKDLTVIQKNDFITNVCKFDSEAHNLMFTLIMCYYKDSNEKQPNITIPYKGERVGDSVDFNLLEFPIPLRHILYRFVIKHEKRLQEETTKDALDSKISEYSMEESRFP